MKVLSCTSPGSFEYREMEKPELKTGQAILKIKRIGICGTDIHAFEGVQPFFDYPRILGHELAAEIVAADADGLHTGDQVTIIPYISCGHCIACRNGKPNCCENVKVAGVHIDGGMTEYLSVPAAAVIPGRGLHLDQLALVEPLAIGAHSIRRAGISKGEFALIIGAGPIGLGAMEFARIAGATVIAMDINGQRLQFCRDQLGIQLTINPLVDDVTGLLLSYTNGDMPSVVIDCTGNLTAIIKAFHYLGHGGRFVLVGLQKGDILFSHPEFHKREMTLMSSRNATRADFSHVIDCIQNKLVAPDRFITHRMTFDETATLFPGLQADSSVIKAVIEL